MPAKKTKKMKKDLEQDQELNEVINFFELIIMINFQFIFNVLIQILFYTDQL